MAEALNRSEVESLLTALNPVRTTPVETSGIEIPNVASPTSSSQLAKRVVGVFEDIRKQLSAVTEQCLQESLRLKRFMPERLPFSEVIQSSPSDMIYLLVESEQNGGDLLVLLEKKFAHQFVSLMVGQTWENIDPVTDLSTIEKRLLMRWIREGLAGVLPPSQWRIVDVELLTAEEDFSTYNPQSPWWCEKWELKSDRLRGPLQIAGQWEFFSALSQQTVRHEESATFQDAQTTSGPRFNQLELTAIWGEAELENAEISELQVGSVLKIKQSVENYHQNVTLEMKGQKVATGQAGESQGSKAVEIQSVEETKIPDQP
ncbi:MAG: FliM/FliN family flagellar motor switch protein [Planctomycetaceae bacterium]|jgi:flagellar motor switch protein FliM|nr:FliM/FliN family flagellar motor switch protein [Planctomycetaceae bacterium]MDC0307597.1 FliM/FliN family flagellar motor switch protein [Planctomycetaceae bacterium]MDG2388496.1 FliM/FliN family flagellar motor switch protein [Planctomycetaceae bacterium]